MDRRIIALEIKWTVSKARDTYGYNICTLYAGGRKAAACNGGGYDMKGTVLGNWLASAFADRLLKLKPEDMPEHSHFKRSENPRRICHNTQCIIASAESGKEIYTQELACPQCGGGTVIDLNDGEMVDDGHYFYGLTYHDPDFDPGKAIPDHAPVFGDNEVDKGKTVEELEAENKSFGLERYQQFYHASSKYPTDRHIIPLIDGGCGWSSVETIAKAIGITVEWHPTKSKIIDLYTAVVDEG